MNAEEMVLCKNARVRLTVDLSKVFYFRPDRGKSAAEIHLTPSANDDSHRLKIYDEREGSILVARKQANIRRAERDSEFRDLKKIDTAKAEISEAWPGCLNSNASIYLGFETTGKNQQMDVLILRDAEKVKEDGLLTATGFDTNQFSHFTTRAKHSKTAESWMRQVMIRDEKDDEIRHFLLVTVTGEDTPITIFYREIEDSKLTLIDYKLDHERRAWQYDGIITSKIQLEGEPAAEQFLPDPPAIIEVPIETTHKNGKVEAQCPECGKIMHVAKERLELGKAQCSKCKVPLIASTAKS